VRKQSRGPGHKALSNNASTVGEAGNQQYSPSSGHGKHKKSNNHLQQIRDNGTIGGATHGYGPMTGINPQLNNILQSAQSTVTGFNNASKKNDKASKDSQPFNKLNKKKRQMTNNLNALQASCNTNPGKERDNSVDATATYNNMRVTNNRMRDNSEGRDHLININGDLNYGSGGESQG